MPPIPPLHGIRVNRGREHTFVCILELECTRLEWSRDLFLRRRGTEIVWVFLGDLAAKPTLCGSLIIDSVLSY